jgi:hypothetical protein
MPASCAALHPPSAGVLTGVLGSLSRATSLANLGVRLDPARPGGDDRMSGESHPPSGQHGPQATGLVTGADGGAGVLSDEADRACACPVTSCIA